MTLNNMSSTVKFAKSSRQCKNYGTLPPQLHDPHPWYMVSVDLIGPWTLPSTTPHRSKRRGALLPDNNEPLQLLA